MTNEQFTELRSTLNQDCEEAMKLKGEAYTLSSTDRLKNFKAVAEDSGLVPLQVWSVYFLKHVSAILHYVKSGKEGPEGVRENIKDARNYLDLGLGIIAEAKSLGDMEKKYANAQNAIGQATGASLATSRLMF